MDVVNRLLCQRRQKIVRTSNRLDRVFNSRRPLSTGLPNLLNFMLASQPISDNISQLSFSKKIIFHMFSVCEKQTCFANYVCILRKSAVKQSSSLFFLVFLSFSIKILYFIIFSPPTESMNFPRHKISRRSGGRKKHIGIPPPMKEADKP